MTKINVISCTFRIILTCCETLKSSKQTFKFTLKVNDRGLWSSVVVVLSLDDGSTNLVKFTAKKAHSLSTTKIIYGENSPHKKLKI